VERPDGDACVLNGAKAVTIFLGAPAEGTESEPSHKPTNVVARPRTFPT